ncbi:methyl-accepting chemotaxis protein [Candidatus Marinarcus aquaticus]|uniref:Methyl-accepting transducer domain-containing protein n=1 Tax=Candidatus Marinarcus aquaticus TaxID=2044504 RepID=A0A4Q0XV71_9BACT|nr:methyl-accepting chemotaxis protein [Candidatus Marinarcus aquaticus]RXJ60059.1 hypothetical protein CRV04_03340 [Candidatus Marinarcus aquaticus]
MKLLHNLSVKAKLRIFSIISVAGFIILIAMMLFMFNSTNAYKSVGNQLLTIKNRVTQLSMNIESYFLTKNLQEYQTSYKQLNQSLNEVTNQMLELDIESDQLKQTQAQIESLNTFFLDIVHDKEQVELYLKQMLENKNAINKIFEKNYDYKLLQFMMKMELYEKNFLINKEIDLDELNVLQIKMRRSIRDSINFTTNKPLQQVIIKALLEYKNLLSNIVELEKSIGKDFNEGKLKNMSELIKSVQHMVTQTTEHIDEHMDEQISLLITVLVTISVVMIAFELMLAFLMFDSISKSLASVKNGLNDFFDFINYKKEHIHKIKVKTKDEFYEMAQEINKNIDTSMKTFENNKEIIHQTNDIIHKISNGFFAYNINFDEIISPDMKQLVASINTMIEQTKNKFNIIITSLENYGEYNFNYQVQQAGLKERLNGDFGSLVASTKLIGNNISEFLAMIMNTGDQLHIDTQKLNETVEKLSSSSENQTLALKNSVQTLQEITQTINKNRENSQQMSNLAQNVSHSASTGYQLATQTATAMNEITNEVSSINEAIEVIDKIAFQTNILSLNAAVEAATAGEAGKGFAVVAQEVRNLATRAADAAKEIKELVEKATQKTQSGKIIAQNMIEGYNDLSAKINDTTALVQELEHSSKIQQQGISKINDDVNILEESVTINNKNAQDISTLSSGITKLSKSLFDAASKSNYNTDVREQVCDVQLVYKTAQLKNDIIKFKNESFTALKLYKNSTLKKPHETSLGLWIKEQEQNKQTFITSNVWKELKKLNTQYNEAVQAYVTHSASKADNDKLIELSSNIEFLTIHIFDKLNEIKVVNCK